MSLTIKLKTLLNNYMQADSQAFAIAVNGVSMYTSDDVIHALLSWYDYTFAYPEYDPPTHQIYPNGYFVKQWQKYVAQNGAGLLNEYQIFNQSDYDPISNYDMTEESADGKRLDSGKSTTTPSGTSTNTNQTYRTGINSSGDGVPTDKNVNTLTYTGAQTETEVQPDNTQSMVFDGGTKTGYHEANEHFLKRSGNIGVTTTQQMAEAEIQLRKHDLLHEFVSRFIARYCYYAG